MFVIAFTGVRGAVSLAAALALPLALPNGDGFPYRDLILFVTFGVILITLVGLGLGLPLVVRWLGVARGRPQRAYRAEHEAEIAARREALDAALQVTRRHDRRPRTVRRGRQADARAARDPRQPDAGHARSRQARCFGSGHRADAGTDRVERKFIHVLLRDGKITDETRRRIERDLDLEEASLANREYRRIPL